MLRSSWTSLDRNTLAVMEPRFGRDFSRVRIHADSTAAESSRAVNARAYTVGNHVVFAKGRYAPETVAGRQLLAHELTHVVQPREGNGGSRRGLRIVESSEASEREAQRNATLAEPAAITQQTGPAVLQRAEDNPSPRDRSRQSKPKDAPPGTVPIDQSGKSRDEIHGIKDGIGAGPKDWVGITPDGHVITSDADGNSEDHGSADDYAHRSSDWQEQAKSAIPTWVWVAFGAVLVVAIIVCFATGVCEAALAAGAAAAVIFGVLKAAGLLNSGPRAANAEAAVKDSSPQAVA